MTPSTSLPRLKSSTTWCTPRRWARAAAGFLPWGAFLLAFAVLARGGFRRLEALGWPEAGAIAAVLLAGLWVTARRLSPPRVSVRHGAREELELGGTMLAAVYIGVALGGELAFPLVYLVTAFLVTFFAPAVAASLVLVAVLLDAVLTLPAQWPAFVTRSVFLALFSVLYHLVLAARLRLARQAEDAAVRGKLREVEERARTFRLVSSGSDTLPGVKDQEKWLLAAVKEIEGATGSVLEVAHSALHTHTVAVFLLSSDERSVTLHDCRSASERVQRGKFAAGEGIFGALLKRGVPVRMNSASPIKGVTHYEAPGPAVRALVAVPIVEGGGHVRGVLVADRLEDQPFGDDEERLLSIIATEVQRAIEVERVMSYIRRSRDEKDRFFRAIEELNRAGAPEQVFRAVVESARQVAELDFCAVTLVSEERQRRTHRIVRMSGVSSAGRALEGTVFEDNAGLVANVVRYGAALPGREVVSMDKQIIFDDHTQIRGLQSLKIFPLVAGDRVLGTLVAGSRKRAALDHDELRMLEVIAIQAAQAVLRAQLYEQMERMATTDGLTGLVNHRTFQGRFDEALAGARRYGRKVSLILTDIDHFKSVNDTYGHPIGDQVLKGVAQILRDEARDTDIVARYGGEEFAVVMPETDAKGAYAIAERIRARLQKESFATEKGSLSVTLSLGIATFPESASEKQHLIDLADQCLYFAKRHGRNQSVCAAQLNQGRERAGA